MMKGLTAIINIVIMQLAMPLTSPAPKPQPALLRVQGLGFAYPQQTVFQNFDAHIGAGVTLVLGGDGAGKTTLLRLVAGDLALQAGSLQSGGLTSHAQPQAWRQAVFWIDPATSAFDALTPRQFFDQQRQRYTAFVLPDAPTWAALLAGLSLTEYLDKPLYMLSTGSKRKVWLAAAFAAGATVTLLDDPFAALDKPSIRFVLQQLALASRWTSRACVLAHYEAPEGVALAQVIDLDA